MVQQALVEPTVTVDQVQPDARRAGRVPARRGQPHQRARARAATSSTRRCRRRWRGPASCSRASSAGRRTSARRSRSARCCSTSSCSGAARGRRRHDAPSGRATRRRRGGGPARPARAACCAALTAPRALPAAPLGGLARDRSRRRAGSAGRAWSRRRRASPPSTGTSRDPPRAGRPGARRRSRPRLPSPRRRARAGVARARRRLAARAPRRDQPETAPTCAGRLRLTPRPRRGPGSRAVGRDRGMPRRRFAAGARHGAERAADVSPPCGHGRPRGSSPRKPVAAAALARDAPGARRAQT